jgi:hypothetical protein
VKIDTEKYPDLASRFNIHALPTLVLFKDGKVAERIVSLIPFQLIEKWNRLQISFGCRIEGFFGGLLLYRKVFSDQRSLLTVSRKSSDLTNTLSSLNFFSIDAGP